MCGIGVFNVDRFTENDVKAMVNKIKYRGVDEQNSNSWACNFRAC